MRKLWILGFSGHNCSTNIINCEPGLCGSVNQGTCKNTQGSYKCECKVGWEGTHCEKNINECNTSKPCMNGATCNDIDGSYECKCQGSYVGRLLFLFQFPL